MIPEVRNFYRPTTGAEEEFFPLLSGGQFRLEQIISRGQRSPAGHWYDQDRDEWVALLCGAATLEFEGEGPLDLVAGDYLLIRAYCRHRVTHTSPDAVWLALHFTA